MRSELELMIRCSAYFRSSAIADSSCANTYYSEVYVRQNSLYPECRRDYCRVVKMLQAQQ
jgi:hypothetical protein